VCVRVCACMRGCPAGYLQNHTRDLYRVFVHVAYVRGSVLRHVDDSLHRLSSGRDDGSAQRGRSVIYDCLVDACTVNASRSRPDKFWQQQAVKFHFTADLTGTINRSEEVVKR